MTQFPQWVAFDPGVPPVLPPIPDHRGRVVALVTGETGLAGGWAGDLAADLARAWTSVGRRVILADAALSQPVLHDVLQVPNAEGLSDALLYGASVRRVAHPVEGEGFFLLTAGTVVGDAESAWSGARWRRLCQGFKDAGVTLVVLVPAGGAGYTRVLEQATDIVYLGSSDEDPGVHLDPTEDRVRAVLGIPKGDAPAEGLAGEELVDPLAVAGGDPLDAVPDVPDVPGIDEILQESPEAHELGHEPELPAQAAGLVAIDPDEESGHERPSSRRNAVILAVVFVVLLGVVAAVWFGYLEIPGVTPAPGDSAPATPTAAAPEPAAPTPTSGVMAFSVALGAYQDEAQAQERADTLSRRSPRHLFMVIPVEVSGSVYHRLMVGPAPDSATAAELAGAVASDVGASPEGWVIRSTPRAFQLGEMASLDAARRRVDVLRGLGIPAYVLAVDYSDASTRYRVYAGAYTDETEASYLLGVLVERGLSSASLTARIGRVPE